MHVEEEKLAQGSVLVENTKNILEDIVDASSLHVSDEYEYKSRALAVYEDLLYSKSNLVKIDESINNLVNQLRYVTGSNFNYEAFSNARLGAYSLIQDSMTLDDASRLNYLQMDYYSDFCKQYETMIAKGYIFNDDVKEQYELAKKFIDSGFKEQSDVIAEYRQQFKDSNNALNDFYGSLRTHDREVAQAEYEAKKRKEEYEALPWYGKAYNNVATAVLSFKEGVISVGETIVDGTIMLGSGAVLYATPVGTVMNITSAIQEAMGVSEEDTIAGKYKSTVKSIIEYDAAGNWYDAKVKQYGLNEYVAYGGVHSAFQTIGSMAGYTALSFIPGGAIAVGTVGALAAAGGAANQAFSSGATYDQALAVSTVAGGAGFASGAALNKVQAAASGATSMLGVAGYTAAGAGVAMSEPVINTVAQYYAYAQNMVDENGNKLYDNIWDYYVDSGGLKNTAFAAVVGGSSTGIVAKKAYSEVTPWSNQDGITRGHVKTAEKNYREHSGDFTSRKDYYDDLARVEANSSYKKWDPDIEGYVGVDKRIGPNDLGITASVKKSRLNEINSEISANTTAGKTRVNVGTSNIDAFDNYVIGNNEGYGSYGIPNDYNFVRLGEHNTNTIINEASSSGMTYTNQFETDSGIPLTSSDRVIHYSYDVDESKISYHTGKELGSNNQRMPGGRLPDGSTEVVHSAISIDDSLANVSSVTIVDSKGNILFDGSLSKLKDIKRNDPSEYGRILYGKA